MQVVYSEGTSSIECGRVSMRLMLCKRCVLSFPEMSLAPCDMVKRSGTGSLSR
jgi:hypothetical protein